MTRVAGNRIDPTMPPTGPAGDGDVRTPQPLPSHADTHRGSKASSSAPITGTQLPWTRTDSTVQPWRAEYHRHPIAGALMGAGIGGAFSVTGMLLEIAEADASSGGILPLWVYGALPVAGLVIGGIVGTASRTPTYVDNPQYDTKRATAAAVQALVGRSIVDSEELQYDDAFQHLAHDPKDYVVDRVVAQGSTARSVDGALHDPEAVADIAAHPDHLRARVEVTVPDQWDSTSRYAVVDAHYDPHAAADARYAGKVLANGNRWYAPSYGAVVGTATVASQRTTTDAQGHWREHVTSNDVVLLDVDDEAPTVLHHGDPTVTGRVFVGDSTT
jgi:hypothetical protein